MQMVSHPSTTAVSGSGPQTGDHSHYVWWWHQPTLGRKGVGGGVGVTTQFPQNDRHVALIILRPACAGKTFFLPAPSALSSCWLSWSPPGNKLGKRRGRGGGGAGATHRARQHLQSVGAGTVWVAVLSVRNLWFAVVVRRFWRILIVRVFREVEFVDFRVFFACLSEFSSSLSFCCQQNFGKATVLGRIRMGLYHMSVPKRPLQALRGLKRGPVLPHSEVKG